MKGQTNDKVNFSSKYSSYYSYQFPLPISYTSSWKSSNKTDRTNEGRKIDLSFTCSTLKTLLYKEQEYENNNMIKTGQCNHVNRDVLYLSVHICRVVRRPEQRITISIKYDMYLICIWYMTTWHDSCECWVV